MAQPVLKVRNLVKEYGSFRAVDGISFEVPKGKVIGLLGPNGAGKTTTINILLGLTLSEAGTIKYFGRDFTHQAFSRINFIATASGLLNQITVRENLLVFAQLYRVSKAKEKIKELAEYFGMTELLPKLYLYLSAGEKTRVNLIKALLNDPELVLMDEPTASLDPDIADKTLTLIEKLRKSRGLSILYTSHNMSEVTRLCDEVIFLDRGKIMAKDTPAALARQIKNVQLKLVVEEGKQKLRKLLTARKEKFSFVSGNMVTIDTEEGMIGQLIAAIVKAGLEITDVEVKKPTLEDVFIKIARGKDAAD